MANSPQARKRARQSEVRRTHNMAQRSLARTHIKKVRKAIDAGDKDAAMAAFRAAEPVLDRFAGKGRIHANKAARHKSRLNAQIRALG
ncbi:MAG: 30S ribosomal protein S20 [Salinisphaeraceae bacterium]|uniref:Small ribosomal subunit protein bS20 n=1 Tax=Spectribacter acetivorans TaxID=3075603 RepID=A0ABU3B635_9GAMM|nr:30S ribosomal protein S20 [Salinisphaera sp. P385]MDT0617297.1 30S ribosomal protein S20 [Salinisphaera sp. P385]